MQIVQTSAINDKFCVDTILVEAHTTNVPTGERSASTTRWWSYYYAGTAGNSSGTAILGVIERWQQLP